jgi:threonine synthase
MRTRNFRFGEWFAQNQICPECGSKHSEVWYNSDYKELPFIIKGNPLNFWQYFYYLPLTRRENIITRNEGAVDLQQWWFLEDFARDKYGLDIKVLVYRNDLNGGTGTFKDVAASLAASIFKENDIKQYCVASQGIQQQLMPESFNCRNKFFVLFKYALEHPRLL